MGDLTRRGLLRGGLAGACSLAAHPLTTTMTFASAPVEARLVVIILRGGMDGLGAVQPIGNAALARMRPNLEMTPEGGLIELGGGFGLHPRGKALAPFWARGELAFAHAVATPYRNKRSHFDGQDLLEAGTTQAATAARSDGWLNRFLAHLPGAEAETAYAVGTDDMRILSGEAAATRWAPGAELSLSPATEALLAHVYAPDPLFANAAEAAIRLAAEEGATSDLPRLSDGQRAEPLADFAARRLRGDARIAAFSLGGWDTHRNQMGALGGALDRLARSILTLHEGLGPVWGKTLVLAMTEFGRTAAENGSKGTDHGTGGAMVMAGGALAGAKVHSIWPGLSEADLFQRRDLMPTDDVRRYAGWALRGLYGTGRDVIEGAVFPRLELGGDPGFLG